MNHSLNLHDIKAVILDMDGVIWRGAEILPGVPELFVFLRGCHIPYAMATNNSTKNVAEYVARLESLGVPVQPEHIITSGLVTAETLSSIYPKGTPIYVIGSESLAQLLTSYGYPINPDEAQAVIVGLDTTLTYDKLRIAGQRILAGATFIGTNGDLTLPTQNGVVPGAGSILAAIQAMTGQKPRLMGKPEPEMFQVALERLGTSPQQTLMVGDRLDTDIEGAIRAGLRTTLVLTGVSTQADIGELTPDAIYENLAALLTDWQNSVK